MKENGIAIAEQVAEPPVPGAQMSIMVHRTNWHGEPPDMLSWEAHSIILVIFLPNIHIQNLT